MVRCYLKGSLGDALHAISCAAGYNIRWLMRAMLRLGLTGLFALLNLLLWFALALRCTPPSKHRHAFAAQGILVAI